MRFEIVLRYPKFGDFSVNRKHFNFLNIHANQDVLYATLSKHILVFRTYIQSTIRRSFLRLYSSLRVHYRYVIFIKQRPNLVNAY